MRAQGGEIRVEAIQLPDDPAQVEALRPHARPDCKRLVANRLRLGPAADSEEHARGLGEGGLEESYAKAMGMRANRLSTRALLEKSAAVESGAHAGVDEATSGNVRNWMECVRSRKTPNAHIEAGYSHSVALCMTIAAIQSGERVTFDDAKQQVMVAGAPWPRT